MMSLFVANLVKLVALEMLRPIIIIYLCRPSAGLFQGATVAVALRTNGGAALIQ